MREAWTVETAAGLTRQATPAHILRMLAAGLAVVAAPNRLLEACGLPRPADMLNCPHGTRRGAYAWRCGCPACQHARREFAGAAR